MAVVIFNHRGVEVKGCRRRGAFAYFVFVAEDLPVLTIKRLTPGKKSADLPTPRGRCFSLAARVGVRVNSVVSKVQWRR